MKRKIQEIQEVQKKIRTILKTKEENEECRIMKDFLQDIDEIRLRIPPAFQSQHRNERKECKPKMINRLTIRGQKV